MTSPKPGHPVYELRALLIRLEGRADVLCIRPGSIAAARALAEHGRLALVEREHGEVLAVRTARTPGPDAIEVAA